MTQQQETPQAKDLAKQFGVIKDDVVRLASMAGRMAADKAKVAQQAAGEMAQTTKAKAGDAYEETQERVRRNPTLAVGVAAGIGFAAARVLLRRRF